MDVDEEIPPPYLPEEPERTLDRGPSTREQRESWPDRRRTRDSVNLNDLLRGAEGQEREAVNKPPEYEEGSAPRREGQ